MITTECNEPILEKSALINSIWYWWNPLRRTWENCGSCLLPHSTRLNLSVIRMRFSRKLPLAKDWGFFCMGIFQNVQCMQSFSSNISAAACHQQTLRRGQCWGQCSPPLNVESQLSEKKDASVCCIVCLWWHGGRGWRLCHKQIRNIIIKGFGLFSTVQRKSEV